MHIGRRNFLLSGAAGLACAALPVAEAALAKPKDDTITIALAARSSTGLNPQLTSMTGADNWCAYQLFDRLVKADDGRWATRSEDFKPALAESWTMSEDAKVWTYKLRPGVKFHKNYGEVTAEDVLFTFGRHLDPKINTNSKTFYSNIAKIEASDAMTVVITLKRPDPLLNASCVSHLTASILCKKAFEEKGKGFDRDPVGTGAYQFDNLNPNKGLLLKAFPEYFDGRAITSNILVQFIADTTARTLAFASGDVDMIEGVRSPGWMATMKQQQSVPIVFDTTAPGSLNTLSLNLTRGPLADLKVRQAIRYAINPAQIASAFGDIAAPMIGVIASQFPGAVTPEELPTDLQYQFDPKRAKTLLAEAGFANGLTIPCYTSQREDYASIMLMLQEQLRAVGINLDMKIIDHATFQSDNRKDKNSLSLWSLSYPPVPTQIIADQLKKSGEVKADGTGGTNYAHYGIAMPGIDDLLDKSLDEPDFEKRIALAKEMEKKILTDLPLLGIITLSYVVARNPEVDIGFKVEAGPAYWSLRRAKRVSV